MTNYDKIKNMSIDEMAEFLNKVKEDCDNCCVSCNGIANININDCQLKINKWLNQEVKPTLSEAERVILENIDKKYKWIARDYNSRLYLYQTKPSKKEGCYTWNDGKYELILNAFSHLFQFITWEDEEPCNIEELLKE